LSRSTCDFWKVPILISWTDHTKMKKHYRESRREIISNIQKERGKEGRMEGGMEGRKEGRGEGRKANWTCVGTAF
jgi:hypothetical protein